MQSVSLADWLRWRAEGCNRLPAVRIATGEAAPTSWLAFADAPVSVLLESARGGRFSFLCDRPAAVFVGRDDGLEQRTPDGGTRIGLESGDPLDRLAARLAAAKAPSLAGWPAMTGGALGLFGYDLVHTWEKLPRRARRDLDLPLFVAIETAELFVYDHETRTLGVVVWRDVVGVDDAAGLATAFAATDAAARAALQRWRRATTTPTNENEEPAQVKPTAAAVPAPSFPPGGFESAVRRILDYIAAGDTYQVNLSLRTSQPAGCRPAPE